MMLRRRHKKEVKSYVKESPKQSNEKGQTTEKKQTKKKK